MITPATEATAVTLRSRLRDDTRKQHQDAENRPVEQAMATGKLTAEQYVEVLAQRYLLHTALETLLDDLARQQPQTQPLIGEDHKLGPVARADLIRFGIDPDEIQPLHATSETLDWLFSLATRNAIALIGPHYVFEGSKNGARFIRRGLLRVWGEEHAKRLCYLDPHGEQQPALWKQFAAQLDALKLDKSQEDEIVNAAAGMFDGIAKIDDQLAERFGF